MQSKIKGFNLVNDHHRKTDECQSRKIHKRLSDIEKTYNDLFLICIGRISENVISY